MDNILVWCILSGIVGYVLNVIFSRIGRARGYLRIDHSNPDKDVYRFEIDDLESLARKKRVLLEIDHHANLSQK